MAQIRQQEIDSNRLKLNIGGEDVDISQGDLREIMEKRAKDLREQRDQMARSGASASELERMDNLLDQYDTLNGELKDGKADDITLEAVQELAKQDPALAAEIKAFKQPQADIAPSVPLSADRLATVTGGATALRETFGQSASPTAPALPDTPAPDQNPLAEAKAKLQSLAL